MASEVPGGWPKAAWTLPRGRVQSLTEPTAPRRGPWPSGSPAARLPLPAPSGKLPAAPAAPGSNPQGAGRAPWPAAGTAQTPVGDSAWSWRTGEGRPTRGRAQRTTRRRGWLTTKMMRWKTTGAWRMSVRQLPDACCCCLSWLSQ